MGQKLAIKGHATRGKEVIRILEMLGGVNEHNETGEGTGYVWNIHKSGYIWKEQINDYNPSSNYTLFTLEEFLEKYPFKVGDKVTLGNKLCSIVWMCWECNNIYYQVQGIDDIFTKKVTAEELKPYKEPKKLAIKGHSTRGKEVIELLEMMGGDKIYSHWIGDQENMQYFINGQGNIDNRVPMTYHTNYVVFTLEEFLEKYPYKLNDFVLCDDGLLGVITKMEWDCEKSDMKYHISFKIPVYNKWYSSKNIKCKYMAVEGKKLAIQGHPTRGKEVIELLEMMGGKNTYEYNAETELLYFFINNDNIIHGSSFFNGNYVCFTLEEFWEKYPFKVDDKVIDEADGCPGVVCEMKWDEGLSDMKYCVAFGNGIDFGWYANNSIKFFKIKKNENLEETCAKNHKMGPKSKLSPKYYEDRLEEIKSNREHNELKMSLDDNEYNFPSFEPIFKMNDELEYKIPDGYEITEVSKDKVFIKPIKSKYPKTYEECCDMLNADEFVGYELMINFPKLINARNAYWKIAGEEMGLDKPWEPNLENEELYCIQNYNKQIVISRTNTAFNKVLIFPTKEMRDAFYENFKKDIEQCKELL